VAWVVTLLLRRYPGQSFIGMARMALGRVVGSGLGLAFSLWWLVILAVTGRILGELVTFALLDLTPQLVVLGLLGASAAAVLWRGPVAVARLAEVLFPVIFGAIVLWFVLGLREGDVRYLLPVGVEGVPEILIATLPPVAFGSSIAAVLLMGEHIESTRGVGRAIYWAVVLVGTVGLMAESLTTMVLGFLRVNQTLPHFHTARLVGFPEFLERVDSALATSIIVGIFITCCVLLFAVAAGVSESLSVRRAYPVVLVLGAAAFAVLTQVLFPTFASLVAVLDGWGAALALAVQGGLPFVVLVVSWIRGVSGRPEASRADAGIQGGSGSS